MFKSDNATPPQCQELGRKPRLGGGLVVVGRTLVDLGGAAGELGASRIGESWRHCPELHRRGGLWEWWQRRPAARIYWHRRGVGSGDGGGNSGLAVAFMRL